MQWGPRVTGSFRGSNRALRSGMIPPLMPLVVTAGSGGTPDPVATLWVDNSPGVGDDSRSKATVAGSGGSLPWATIGRAAWGSTNRAAPNTSECAQPGDVVSIMGSGSLGSPQLYTTSVQLNNGQDAVYRPAVTGTAGNYITFKANGYVKLGANAANAPVLGNDGTIDYVKWFANRSNSRFILVCDGRGGATDDTKGDTSVVNTRPDTGPVFFVGHFWIEGFDIDGGPMIDYGDNWSAIRGSNGQGFTIRNNYLHDFRKDENSDTIEDTSHNQTGITLYGAQNGLIENNLIKNNGAGVYFKDTLTYQATFGNTVRKNWFSGVNVGGNGVSKGVAWSLIETSIAHDTNFVYQNVFVDLLMALSLPSRAVDDEVYNNTIARTDIGFDGVAAANGARYWNNIVSVTDTAIYQDGVTIGNDTVCDLEHNNYFGFNSSTFMQDSSGSHTFAAYLSEYPSLDQAATASVNSNPLFTNAGADDFTLQSGSPARGIASDLGIGTDAGAYQFGVSVTIGLEAGQP